MRNRFSKTVRVDLTRTDLVGGLDSWVYTITRVDREGALYSRVNVNTNTRKDLIGGSSSRIKVARSRLDSFGSSSFSKPGTTSQS